MERRGVRVLAAILVGAVGACAGTGAIPARAPRPRPVEVVRDAPEVRRLPEPGWVEARVSVVSPDHESLAQARARALDQARAAACEAVSGVTVRSDFLSFQAVRDQEAGQLVQLLTAVSSEAVVVDERVVSERVTPLPQGGFTLDLVLRARVVDRRAPGSDPGFSVEVRLPRERFLDGEEVTIQIRSTRNAHLVVVNVTEAGATLLLPNQYEPDPVAAPGEWVRFPGPDLVARGVRVLARLPEGRLSARESLVVLALRGRAKAIAPPARGRVFREADASGSGRFLYEVLSPLADLPPSEWAFAQAAYEIWSR